MTDSKIQFFTSMIMNVNKTDIATAANEAVNASLPQFGNVLSNAGSEKLQMRQTDAGKELFPQLTKTQGGQKAAARTQNGSTPQVKAENSGAKVKFEQKLQQAKAKAETLPDNVEDVMAQLNTGIVKTVREGLNVKEEDLIAALDELGLNITDLLDSSNLAQVFSYFSEEASLVEVLLNTDYLQTVDNLTVAVAEVLNEFEMTLPEFDQLLENVKNQMPQLVEPQTMLKAEPQEVQTVPVPQETQEVHTEVQAETPQATTPETVQAEVEQVVQEAPKEQNLQEPVAEVSVAEVAEETVNHPEDKPVVMEAVKTEVIRDSQPVAEEPQPEKVQQTVEETVAVVSEKPDTETESGEEEENDFSQNLSKLFEKKPEKNTFEHHTEPMNVEAHVETQTMVTPEGTTVTTESVKVVDLQNLVTEITNYIRMHAVGNEISSIEMQLTPANLGKVLVEVVTNQGEITARIATQTEAAKEAMEANMVTLKDNLESQGIKVNAVEVTVETHSFEENLQEDGSKEQEQLRREQEKQNRRNNLNLNEMTLEDLEGLMSEEDMVVAKMMKDNGNVMNVGV